MPLDPYDPDAVLAECGPFVQVVLREAMDSGFDKFRRSRSLDPDAYNDFTPTTLAGTLVNRMYPVLVELVDAADPEGTHLRTRWTDNNVALELFMGALLYAKLKRVRDTVSRLSPGDHPEVDDLIDLEVVEYGVPRNIPTQRVLDQRTPGRFVWRQSMNLFADVAGVTGVPDVQVPGDDADRLCLIAGFDLDLTQDRLQRHRIALYNRSEQLWSRPLDVLDADAIAAISAPLAGRVEVLRQARIA